MDDRLSKELQSDLDRFDVFLADRLHPYLRLWENENRVPRAFFEQMAEGGWLGAFWNGTELAARSGLRETLLLERLAAASPGVAVTALIASDLGLTALRQYGSRLTAERIGPGAAAGRVLICLGNSENIAGSDAGGIAMTAARRDAGWVLNGAKAYVTNGFISDYAVVTAITDPAEKRTRRISMFLVDMESAGVKRRRLNKQVWNPSDLSRLEFADVEVPGDCLMGERGRGLRQLLSIFTHSRVPISGLALGTARGAFDLAVDRMGKRKIFGRPISDYQAKAFEAADLSARLEAARLAVLKAGEAMDRNGDFRFEASIAKYLSVDAAQRISVWATDLFGASSVMAKHPVHKFPLDAWAVSLAEGTQDVQKLVIFREMMKRRAI